MHPNLEQHLRQRTKDLYAQTYQAWHEGQEDLARNMYSSAFAAVGIYWIMCDSIAADQLVPILNELYYGPLQRIGLSEKLDPEPKEPWQGD